MYRLWDPLGSLPINSEDIIIRDKEGPSNTHPQCQRTRNQVQNTVLLLVSKSSAEFVEDACVHAQSCLTLHNPMDCSSVVGSLSRNCPGKNTEVKVIIFSSRGSLPWPKDWKPCLLHIPCKADEIFTPDSLWEPCLRCDLANIFILEVIWRRQSAQRKKQWLGTHLVHLLICFCICLGGRGNRTYKWLYPHLKAVLLENMPPSIIESDQLY